MEIIIDIDSEVPLFAQLIEQIKKAVINELINPGDSMPSIRQLANDLSVNSKTVAKAYKLLERDDVILSKGYRGTFIHKDAIKNSGKDIGAKIETTINEAITICRAEGATDSEIRIIFATLMQNK